MATEERETESGLRKADHTHKRERAADSRQAGVTFFTVWLNSRLETREKILELNSLGLQRLGRADGCYRKVKTGDPWSSLASQ